MSNASASEASGLRPREPRKPVNITARMRTEQGWCDIAIRNVSSGGFMAQSAMPPRRGYYIEVRYGDACIVGYVVWSSGSRFGARSQDTIDIPALVAKRPVAGPGTERRKIERRPGMAALSIDAQAARARQFGRTLEFVILGVTIAAATLFLVSAVSEVLEKPFSRIEATLDAQNGRSARTD